jgi:enamine deaminase RidA (YjgF/YER057c/UK114 family)
MRGVYQCRPWWRSPSFKWERDRWPNAMRSSLPAGRLCTRSTAIRRRSGQAIFLFVSGQVGSREDGSPEPVFDKQVQLAFDNLTAVLMAAGCTFDDVVDVTSFHTDPRSQWEAVNAARLKAIGDPPYPNWTAVGVNWLAGFDFEIKVIARIPHST